MGKMLKKRAERVNIRIIFRLFIAAILPLLIVLSLNFPINIDEPLHYDHSKKVIEWYRSGGENKECFDTPWSNLKYYGQSVDNLTVLINKCLGTTDEYKIRHITGAVFAWLFVLFTSLLAFEISGRYRTAILAGLVLMIIPPVMGQFCNNLKDIPFAAGYAFAILALTRFLKKMPVVPWSYVFQLSVAIAFLISVRVGGLIIYPYFLLLILLWIFIHRQQNLFSVRKGKIVLRLFIQISVILLAGYFLGILFWPYGLIRPLVHPFESLSLMEHYSISIRQIFCGEWYWSTSLPSYYLMTWLLISMPEAVLAGLILYLICLFVNKNKNKIEFSEYIILFTFLFPVVYIMIIKSNLYSGWRQMYFIAGHISVLAALGIDRGLFTLRKRKSVVILMLVILMLGSVSPILHYVRNKETAYVYFNLIAGGNRKAWGNFEYDYYWHGMKKAAEWFDENIPGNGDTTTIASNFDLSLYLGHRDDIEMRYVHFDNRSTASWDYGIFGINYVHPYQLNNGLWQPPGIIKQVEDSYGKPLVVIIKRKADNDLRGIQYARESNYRKAIPLLETAVEYDANNSMLFEYLAECYYYLGDTTNCESIIKEAKELHPWSEKINMIEAQMLYDRGHYENALEKCLSIVKNNNKYYNIVPLLISCYEKTGDSKKADYYRKKLENKSTGFDSN